MRLLLLFSLLVLGAACDTPDPLDPSNPYDPEFGGARIPTPPANVQVTSTSPTSITLTWQDASSFETGYRVLEVFPEGLRPEGARVVADLPPDAESFVVDELVEDGGWPRGGRRFSVLSLPLGEGAAIPADTVSVWYPYSVSQLGRWTTRGYFSESGETLFVPVLKETWVYDLEADMSFPLPLQKVKDAYSPIYALQDGRAVGYFLSWVGSGSSRVYDADLVTISRTGEEARVRLALPPITGEEGCDFRSDQGGVVVSSGGSRAATTCPGSSTKPVVWDVTTGARVDIPGPPRETFDEVVVALSPAGDRMLVQVRDDAILYDLGTGQPVWSQPLPVTGAIFSKDGTRIVTSGQTVHVLDAATGRILASRDQALYASAVDTNGAQAVISAFRTVQIVDLQDLRTQRLIDLRSRSQLKATDAHLTRDGLRVLTETGRLYTWDFTQPWEVVPD